MSLPIIRPHWNCLFFSRSRSILANAETRALIRRMSWENRLWDAPRIHGELAMLGVRVSRTTVAKYMARRPGPPSHTWRTFLRNHARALVASGADAAWPGGTHTMYAEVIGSLRRWLNRFVASWCLRAAHRDTGTISEPSAHASLSAVWLLDAIERVSIYERSPPDSRSSPHHDASSSALYRRSLTLAVCPLARALC